MEEGEGWFEPKKQTSGCKPKSAPDRDGGGVQIPESEPEGL